MVFRNSKLFLKYFITILILILMNNISYSESIFLKDGSIVEGKIVQESDRNVKIKMGNNLTVDIPRKRVMRTLYTEDYKNKKYLYKTNGTVVNGHIVYEDKYNYIIRKNLNSVKEINIKKSEVSGIMKNRIMAAGRLFADKGYHGEVRKFGNMEFVFIKGGEFIMGATGENGEKNEYPRRKIKIDSFWIGKYEVTQKQYNKLIQSNRNNRDDNKPVVNISWDEAMKFCKLFKMEYNIKARLPYEAEWEYSVKAGSSTKYYWGDKMNNDYCWHSGNSGGFLSKKIQPVGQKKPNKWGLYDMTGNVSEWCMDWYKNDYYLRSANDNPKGPSEKERDKFNVSLYTGDSGVYVGGKVRRGGSIDNDQDELTTSFREYGLYSSVTRFFSYEKKHITGFRMVLPLE